MARALSPEPLLETPTLASSKDEDMEDVVKDAQKDIEEEFPSHVGRAAAGVRTLYHQRRGDDDTL